MLVFACSAFQTFCYIYYMKIQLRIGKISYLPNYVGFFTFIYIEMVGWVYLYLEMKETCKKQTQSNSLWESKHQEILNKLCFWTYPSSGVSGILAYLETCLSLQYQYFSKAVIIGFVLLMPFLYTVHEVLCYWSHGPAFEVHFVMIQHPPLPLRITHINRQCIHNC
jgi:hypothetical protein